MATNIIGAADAARILGMTRGGLAVAAREGRVPVLARIGKRETLVFDREAVEAEAAARRPPRGGIGMIPPIGFKLDKATVEFLRDDFLAFSDWLHENGHREGSLDDALSRIDSAVRIYGVTS